MAGTRKITSKIQENTEKKVNKCTKNPVEPRSRVILRYRDLQLRFQIKNRKKKSP